VQEVESTEAGLWQRLPDRSDDRWQVISASADMRIANAVLDYKLGNLTFSQQRLLGNKAYSCLKHVWIREGALLG